ncbi:MAG TPA: hypothetical protein VK698_22020 [Kofleriaceae bacterium]|nr:hypothetical protein [Kofleriaceae bacterium]
MGLAERRATKIFQDKSYPALVADIQKLAGFPVPIEVQWEQLAKESYADSFEEAWRKVYFVPIIDALKSVCRDDLGKEALKAGLQKIVLSNTKDTYSADAAVSFTGGELAIDHDPVTNVDDVKYRADAVVKALEKGL